MDRIEIMSEEKVVETIIDFAPSIRQWLLEKGYERKKGCLHAIEYRKGLLEITPENSVVENGVRFYIGRSVVVDKEGIVDHIYSKNPFGQELDTLGLEIAQAQLDIKEFYDYLFKKDNE